MAERDCLGLATRPQGGYEGDGQELIRARLVDRLILMLDLTDPKQEACRLHYTGVAELGANHRADTSRKDVILASSAAGISATVPSFAAHSARLSDVILQQGRDIKRLRRELEDVILQQGRDIERLRRELEAVRGRMNKGSALMPADDKPPHY